LLSRTAQLTFNPSMGTAPRVSAARHDVRLDG
jgi:hypothetical protein